MVFSDAATLAMSDNDVENVYSSDNERAVPATRAKQYGKGLLMITLVLAVLAGGVAVFQRPGSGPTKNAAISESVELTEIGKKDLVSFNLRLAAHTAGKELEQICLIFSQVQSEDKCEPSPILLQETCDLAKYYTDNKDDQPFIQQHMISAMTKSKKTCAITAKLPKDNIALFTMTLDAFTKGKSWPEVCTIYSSIKGKEPCTVGPYCHPQTAELTKYYKDNEKDQPAIDTHMLMTTTTAGASCL